VVVDYLHYKSQNDFYTIKRDVGSITVFQTAKLFYIYINFMLVFEFLPA